MKYAVALLNFFDNENKIAIVEAPNPVTAMVEAARSLMKPPPNEWLDEFLVDISDDRVEDIQMAFFDTDLAISKPVCLDKE